MTFEDSQTDLSLLQRSQRGEDAAWHRFVDLYGPLIEHWCHRCGLNAHESADCQQEVLMGLVQGLSRYTPQQQHGSFRAWLWTVTRHKIIDFCRKQRAHATSTGGSSAQWELQQIVDPLSVPCEEPTEPRLLSDLTARGLEQVRQSVEPQTWQAFWRSAIDEVPSPVVARELNISVASVRQARSRVLRKLRLLFGDAQA